jgi:hypothetical protein
MQDEILCKGLFSYGEKYDKNAVTIRKLRQNIRIRTFAKAKKVSKLS